jgi:hypothetical protein
VQVEPIVLLGGRVIFAAAQFIIDPESSSAEDHEFLFAEPADDAFVDHLAGIVAVDHVLGLPDVKLREAIDRKVRQKSECIGPAQTPLPQPGPVSNIACLLPRHALIDPVGILHLAEADVVVALRRAPHAGGRDLHSYYPVV